MPSGTGSLAQLVRADGRWRLVVDGRPFLLLGLQWDCDSCFSAEEMSPLFAHASKLGANTAALPLYWREVEPEPDRFCFDMLDERLSQARRHGLRLVLLWFATWKNACHWYAPEYIRSDPDAYRVVVDTQGKPTTSPCPTCDATWQRDRQALVKVAEHLAGADEQGTVVLMQIENEPGVLGTDRCHCAECERQFAEGGWEGKYGDLAAEAFSAASFASYMGRLSAEFKVHHPIPTYVNAWLPGTDCSQPGEAYPAGGPVPAVLDIYREVGRDIDFAAPDIYQTSHRDFARWCKPYARPDNALYVAETGSSISSRVERNVFYAIGEHAAIGYDPWAIDSSFPERDTPLVDPIGGEWAEQAFLLRDSYAAIGRAIEPIAEAQGTERLFTLVQEPRDAGACWDRPGVHICTRYIDSRGAGRGFIVERNESEYLLVGVGFRVRFGRRSGGGSPLLRVEYGRFEKDRWVCLHPVRREGNDPAGSPITLLEPGVVRVWLQASR